MATISAVPDPNDTMKGPYLSRRLAKEKTTCPSCHKTMAVGTLAWSHRCRVVKPIPEDVVQLRLDMMRESAVKSFQQRQERLAGAGMDCPMEAASSELAATGNGGIATEARQEGQGQERGDRQGSLL